MPRYFRKLFLGCTLLLPKVAECFVSLQDFLHIHICNLTKSCFVKYSLDEIIMKGIWITVENQTAKFFIFAYDNYNHKFNLSFQS